MNKTKLKITSLIAFSFLSFTGHAQSWQQLPVTGSVILNEFYAKDQQNMVVVGIDGFMMQSQDGGNTFQNVNTGITDNLTSVACTNENCFVLAENNILVSSDNVTWNRYDLPAHGAKIYFFEKRIGFITGCKKGTFMKSVNGGSTWEVIETNQARYSIRSISMYSELEGCAIAADANYNTRKPIGKILKTTDGGQTWNEVSTQNDHSYNALCMVNAVKGFAVGYFGQVMTTNDGGNTWTQTNLSINDNMQSVYFADANVGYMVGSLGKVLKTTNGGATWQVLDTGIKDFFRSCIFSDINNGYILAGRQILKTSTGGL